MKIYGAYGSNLNLEQMSERCPGAKTVGVVWLEDWRLCFRGMPGRTYLSIEPAKGNRLPLGLWSIDDAQGSALDEYEDYPDLYDKLTMNLDVKMSDGTQQSVSVLVYVMVDGLPYNFPSNSYIEVCRHGYRDFGLDPVLIDRALELSKKNKE